MSCSKERLHGLILAMSHETDEFEILAVKDTIIQLTATATREETITECIQMLLDRCEDNWRFSESAVRCVRQCSIDEQFKAACGTALRPQFLKQLQTLYKRKFFCSSSSSKISMTHCSEVIADHDHLK